jgi:hypothetical protein
VILTYESLVELNFDISQSRFSKGQVFREGIDYQLPPTKLLPQQEAVSYDVNGRDIIYTTEVWKKLFRTKEAPQIIRVVCSK